MAKTKEIQRRIKSISSTKKITKAMEMVSAAKMRKAIEAVLRTRTYANLSWATVLNLSKAMEQKGETLHPLLSKREEVKRVAIIMISSNRGLCGGFNTALINKVHHSIEKHHKKEGKNIEVELLAIGKKGAAIHHYYGYNIVAAYPKMDNANEVEEIIPVAEMVVSDFLSGKYDKVMVAYTDFFSATKQIPRVKQLLPIDINTQDEFLGIVGDDPRLKVEKKMLDEKEKKHTQSEGYMYDYTFEPNPKEVLDEMIPRLLEVQLYQALLESNAAEHSARMAAMHQATEAGNDIVNELTLFYNKARQASITSELAEISAGANALAE